MKQVYDSVYDLNIGQRVKFNLPGFVSTGTVVAVGTGLDNDLVRIYRDKFHDLVDMKPSELKPIL